MATAERRPAKRRSRSRLVVSCCRGANHANTDETAAAPAAETRAIVSAAAVIAATKSHTHNGTENARMNGRFVAGGE